MGRYQVRKRKESCKLQAADNHAWRLHTAQMTLQFHCNRVRSQSSLKTTQDSFFSMLRRPLSTQDTFKREVLFYYFGMIWSEDKAGSQPEIVFGGGCGLWEGRSFALGYSYILKEYLHQIQEPKNDIISFCHF